MSGGASTWGLRSLTDGFLRYFQPGLPVYLRQQYITNQPNDYSALGFMPSVSGGQGGYNDTLIDPPPDVQELSLHNIGIMGGRLQFGAKMFLVSDTFVENQMDSQQYTDPLSVWRDPSVVGIIYGDRLFAIESITHEDVGGATTLWKLICNAAEYPEAPAP